MGNIYRKWKHKLHQTYLEYDTDEERIANRPKGLRKKSWLKMIKLFKEENFKQLSRQYADNRTYQMIKQSTGPTPFCKIQYQMMNDKSGELPLVYELWKHTHSKRGETNAWHDNVSAKVYETFKGIESKPAKGGGNPIESDEIYYPAQLVKSTYTCGKGQGYKHRNYFGVYGPKSNQQDKILQLENQLNDAKLQVNAYGKEMEGMKSLLVALLAQKGNTLCSKNSEPPIDSNETQSPDDYEEILPLDDINKGHESTFVTSVGSEPPSIKKWFPDYTYESPASRSAVTSQYCSCEGEVRAGTKCK